MSIRIEKSRCIGCGKCAEACPGNLLWIQNKKADIRIPEDCWGCTSCLKVCPVNAISYYLGADIGGNGAEMTVHRHDSFYDWQIRFPDGKETIISVNRKNANQY